MTMKNDIVNVSVSFDGDGSTTAKVWLTEILSDEQWAVAVSAVNQVLEVESRARSDR